MRSPLTAKQIQFPPKFIDAVHEALKNKLPTAAYQAYFQRATTPFFLGEPNQTDQNEDLDFESICCIAGKQCGLTSYSSTDEGLPLLLLESINEAINECNKQEKGFVLHLFGGKPPENITTDDVLEIGLYEKIDHTPRSAGEQLLRHQNLKAIYASAHQNRQRWKYALPETINYWTVTQRDDNSMIELEKEQRHKDSHLDRLKEKKPLSTNYADTQLLLTSAIHRRSELFPEELCQKQYIIHESMKQPPMFWQIARFTKNKINNLNDYFLTTLQKILDQYYDGLKNFPYQAIQRASHQSDLSKTLYSDLFDILLETKDAQNKIECILIRLNEELDIIGKTHNAIDAKNPIKPRRLINMLTEAGFMAPDVLRCTTTHAFVPATVQPDPSERLDANQVPC